MITLVRPAVSEYVPLLMLFVIGVVLSGGFILLSSVIGKKKYNKEKMAPYECGLDPIGPSKQRFSVKFYLVAMLFILFDIEIVFLYPWATLFNDFKAAGLGLFLFVEMVVFLGVLGLGLIYVFKRRALDWE